MTSLPGITLVWLKNITASLGRKDARFANVLIWLCFDFFGRLKAWHRLSVWQDVLRLMFWEYVAIVF